MRDQTERDQTERDQTQRDQIKSMSIPNQSTKHSMDEPFEIVDDVDPFKIAVLDTQNPAPVFVVKGVAFTVKYPIPAKKVSAAAGMYKCNT